MVAEAPRERVVLSTSCDGRTISMESVVTSHGVKHSGPHFKIRGTLIELVCPSCGLTGLHLGSCEGYRGLGLKHLTEEPKLSSLAGNPDHLRGFLKVWWELFLGSPVETHLAVEGMLNILAELNPEDTIKSLNQSPSARRERLNTRRSKRSRARAVNRLARVEQVVLV